MQTDLAGRDLLRYLLLNGECSGVNIHAAALFQSTMVGQYLDQLVSSGLLRLRIERIGAGAIETDRWWSINPDFGSRLQRILFPRPDAEGSPKFKLG